MFNTVVKFYKNLLPYICCICNQSSDLAIDLCSCCKGMFPILKNRCGFCKAIVAEHKGRNFCEKCSELIIMFDKLYAIYPYEGVAKQMLHALKYNGKLMYGRILGEILCNTIIKSWYKNQQLPQAIVPIPLHSLKLKQRGFNQAAEILRVVHTKLKIPIINNLCIKLKPTQPQAGLDLIARRANLKNSFAIHPNFNYTQIKNLETIVIFDDVVTTMSTIKEVCRVIKNKINIKIEIWCICRA